MLIDRSSFSATAVLSAPAPLAPKPQPTGTSKFVVTVTLTSCLHRPIIPSTTYLVVSATASTPFIFSSVLVFNELLRETSETQPASNTMPPPTEPLYKGLMLSQIIKKPVMCEGEYALTNIFLNRGAVPKDSGIIISLLSYTNL